MIWVGLTGGIASGKSLVARFLREGGAFIIDADEIAHRVMLKGGPAYRPVVEFFGEEILDRSGEIDRKRLGRIVFTDAGKRGRLNQLVHPAVFDEVAARRGALTREHPKGVLIFDAPLLIEADVHREMDWVVVAYASRATQVKRLVERDGLTREEADRRIDAQIPLEEKVKLADEVVDTEKPLEAVQKEVEALYKRLKERA